jgi:hypothetical protein
MGILSLLISRPAGVTFVKIKKGPPFGEPFNLSIVKLLYDNYTVCAVDGEDVL